jgi:hypothetical protein
MARNVAGVVVLGSFFLLAGCGDPVPPAVQAGISIHLQEYDSNDPVHGMERCPPSRHWVNVPYDRDRPPTSQKQLTDGNASARAVNNQDGNTVSCSVKASGSGFTVKGDGTAYAESDGTKFKPSIVHLRIPSISEGSNSATGTITVQDDASLNPYTSEQCVFSVQPDSTSPSLGVAAGKIWAKVRCEQLGDPSSPGSACLVDTGYFVLENCSQ